jgi:hypothetical protein
VAPLIDSRKPEFERGFVSNDYGAKRESVIVRWSERVSVPLVKYWAIIPVRGDEDEALAADLIPKLRAQVGTPQNS